MEISAVEQGNRLILRPEGVRIDAAVAIQFKDRMRERLRQPPPAVVLDLTGVEFIDSSGLGAIVAVMKMVGDGSFALAGLSPAVARVFRLTRMDQVMTILPTVDGADSGDAP